MAKLTSITNVVLAGGVVTFDNGIEIGITVPLSMVETNSSHLYRELRKRGWTLDGRHPGFNSQKSEAVAGHIQSIIAAAGDPNSTILIIDPIYFIPREGIALPDIDPAAATSSIVIAGAAAGDGDVGIAVTGGLGGPYVVTPTALDTAAATATALAAVIDAGPDFAAAATLVVINMTDKTVGAAGNDKIIIDANTDTTQSAGGFVQPNGGNDGSTGNVAEARAEPSVALGFGGEFFVIPYSWVTGDSASIRRELAKLGFSLAGPGHMVSRKADTIAAHVAASMELFVP